MPPKRKGHLQHAVYGTLLMKSLQAELVTTRLERKTTPTSPQLLPQSALV
jgi:hypothetical protein